MLGSVPPECARSSSLLTSIVEDFNGILVKLGRLPANVRDAAFLRRLEDAVEAASDLALSTSVALQPLTPDELLEDEWDEPEQLPLIENALLKVQLRPKVAACVRLVGPGSHAVAERGWPGLENALAALLP